MNPTRFLLEHNTLLFVNGPKSFLTLGKAFSCIVGTSRSKKFGKWRVVNVACRSFVLSASVQWYGEIPITKLQTVGFKKSLINNKMFSLIIFIFIIYGFIDIKEFTLITLSCFCSSSRFGSNTILMKNWNKLVYSNYNLISVIIDKVLSCPLLKLSVYISYMFKLFYFNKF